MWTLSSVSLSKLSSAQLGTWPSPGTVWCTSFRAHMVTQMPRLHPTLVPILACKWLPTSVSHTHCGEHSGSLGVVR